MKPSPKTTVMKIPPKMEAIGCEADAYPIWKNALFKNPMLRDINVLYNMK